MRFDVQDVIQQKIHFSKWCFVLRDCRGFETTKGIRRNLSSSNAPDAEDAPDSDSDADSPHSDSDANYSSAEEDADAGLDADAGADAGPDTDAGPDAGPDTDAGTNADAGLTLLTQMQTQAQTQT